MYESTKQLNTEQLTSVGGGEGLLTSEDMRWYVNMIRDAKRQGATMEYFIKQGGNAPQVIEFVKFMWDQVSV